MMKCIILCAGYATRLYPLTLNQPKALLKIKGRPILDYIMDKIPADIKEIILVSNNKFYSQFAEWSKKYHGRVKVLDNGSTEKENMLGGVADLYFGIDKGKINDDLLVILGDNLFDFGLEDFINSFKQRKKTLMGAYEFNSEDIKKFGVVEVKNEKIIAFEEKPQHPKSNLASIGIYLLAKQDLKEVEDYMKTDKPKDGPGYIIKHLASIQDVFIYNFKGRWFDIGNQEVYNTANISW